MQSESKICQNCHQSFVVEPEDFGFYERMNVPPPTWCPECRMARRMVWRNDRSLYRETCARCGAATLSVYTSRHSFPVYCHDCWRSDTWDGITYGREYDFSRPFFTQFGELLSVVPRQAIFLIDAVNSQYSNFTAWGKNLYLSYSALDSEDVYYSKIVGEKSRFIFDSYDTNSSENCYWINQGERNYNAIFLLNSRDCMDSAFLFDCANCKNCFMSTNLRNAKYVFRGVKCSEEEYKKKLQDEYFGSFRSFDRLKEEFHDRVVSSLHRFVNAVRSVNASGNDLVNVKNTRYAFSGYNLENVRYAFRGFDSRDSMDVIHFQKVERMYEYISGGARDSADILFSMSLPGNCQGVEYSDFCGRSSRLFACIGLRNKEYCILNRQYTKEEYESLIPKIKEHMNAMPYVDKKGRTYRYGEFFPPELSPFAYNETIAQEYFPLSKEEALRQGYRWKDPETKDYAVTMKPESLPDHVNETDDSILKETIGCRHEGTCLHQCTTAFRIIPEELQFYRRMNLPLPRLCPNCRHYERLSQRNPLRLWTRQCMCDKTAHDHKGRCPREFETSYAPERTETVYCEECYQREVV